MNPYPSSPAMMPPAPPTWSISKLVKARTGASSSGRRTVLSRLAYANNGKAARQLDLAVASGRVGADLRRRLPAALDVDPAVVDSALERTCREIAAYAELIKAWTDHHERCAFRPHVVIRVEIRHRRLPLFMIGITGAAALLRLDLRPDITAQTEERQFDEVRREIREYMEGPLGIDLRMTFHEPIGYTYCPAYDEAWDISPAGELAGRTDGPARVGHAAFRVAKRDIHALPLSAGPAK